MVGQHLVDESPKSPEKLRLSPPTKKASQPVSNFNIKSLINPVPHAPPVVKIEDIEMQSSSASISNSYKFNMNKVDCKKTEGKISSMSSMKSDSPFLIRPQIIDHTLSRQNVMEYNGSITSKLNQTVENQSESSQGGLKKPRRSRKSRSNSNTGNKYASKTTNKKQGSNSKKFEDALNEEPSI